jgi:hypothetical protein
VAQHRPDEAVAVREYVRADDECLAGNGLRGKAPTVDDWIDRLDDDVGNHCGDAWLSGFRVDHREMLLGFGAVAIADGVLTPSQPSESFLALLGATRLGSSGCFGY